METRARYTIIGLFTLIVIAVAFVFVYWLKRLDESGVRSTMYLEFPGTVSGLEPGGSVYFNGLKVGEVVGLSFKPEDPNIIVVTTSVRADTPIKTDTKAKVGSSILTGVAYIELNGGSSKAPSVFTANPPLVVGQTGGDIMAELSIVGQKVSQIATRVDTLVAENQAAIKESIENIRQFSGALAQNAPGVSDFLKNVSDMSQKIAALSGRLDQVVAEAEKVVAAVDPTKVKSVVDNAAKVVGDVADASKGVVDDVKKAAADLSDFTSNAKATLAKVNDAISAFEKQKISNIVDNVSLFSDRLKSAGPDIDAIVADVKKTAANATAFTDNLNKHNDEINSIVADAKSLAARLNESSKKLDVFLGKATDLVSVEGGKNFFQEAADASASIKRLADSLNARVPEIAASIAKFSDRGLENVDALVSELRNTATRIDRVVGNIEKNPSSLVFGGNSGVREYNRR
ncbi:MAG TPA: MlaD family protein [Bauldia sp.]|nr:MlaD family protein [Bauldia sp.]